MYGDQSDVYKVRVSDQEYFLKIGTNLEEEYRKVQWLVGRLTVPRVIGFTQVNKKDVLLLSAIKGQNLAVLSKMWPPEKIVDALVKVLHQFHSANKEGWPFSILDGRGVLIHGDACLPNFIFQGDVFSGYVDLGGVTVGSIERDFSAAVWSLQYNLGPGFGLAFLRKYGIEDASEEMVEKLRLQYEDMQREWNLL